MIKLIIFDLSEVCYSNEEQPFLIDFCKKNKLDYEKFDSEYQELLVQSEVDDFSGQELWKRLLEQFNVKGDPDQIIKDMIAIKEERKDVLDFVKSLSVKTAYLTNYNQAYWEVINKKFKVDNHFDFGLVSYQIKARKPAVEGFKAIMDHFKVNANETVFTDDTAKNLVNAKELGIHTIEFTSLSDFKKGLDKKL
tara:strand:- start:4036 stop:4617 length:582 start_codon:yes stop_codon:yes gene_type:complete